MIRRKASALSKIAEKKCGNLFIRNRSTHFRASQFCSCIRPSHLSPITLYEIHATDRLH
jgi:hypothetical protein